MKQATTLIVILLLLQSCVKNNANPAWLNIQTWTLKVNSELNGEEGALSHNFSDVYLLVDDAVIGYFELPIKLPILESGKHKITLYPAIKNNGISATKRVYPLCQKHEFTLDLQADQVYEITPETRYENNTKFWIEDFEDAALKLFTEGISSANIKAENDPNILVHGNYYGHVALTTTDSLWFAYMTPAISLPQQGAEVYLEIDYRNTNSLLTGLLAYSGSGVANNPNIQLNPQDDNALVWKKIYIDLKELVSNSIGANAFAGYFNAGIDPGRSQADVYIDNIKVIHF